jgi:TRAP-type uncharacterized transport system fused permease subunit
MKTNVCAFLQISHIAVALHTLQWSAEWERGIGVLSVFCKTLNIHLYIFYHGVISQSENKNVMPDQLF